jgi:hypothetical protein
VHLLALLLIFVHADAGQWTVACRPAPGFSAPQPVRPVARDSAEWRRLEPAVARMFEARERDERIGGARVAAAPIAIAALYASSAAPVYYVEAAKRIEDASGGDPDTDPAGVLHVRVSGWLRDAPGSVRAIGSRGTIEWEQLDRATARTAPEMAPLGTVRDGSIWVMSAAGGSTVVLYQLEQARVRTLLRTPARC